MADEISTLLEASDAPAVVGVNSLLALPSVVVGLVAGTGLGSKIIHTMAATLQTQVEYINRAPGTAARLVLVAEVVLA